jgi:hypothetical protein
LFLALSPFCALIPLGCGNVSSPVTPSIWVGAWGTSPVNAQAVPDNRGGANESFRFLIYPTIGGTEERVRFSNFFATTPVMIGAARLSVGTDGSPAIDPAHDAALTFGGQSSVTLAPGQILTSDPVNVTYTFGQSLAISVFVQGNFGSLAQHNSLFIANYNNGDGGGNVTGDATGNSFTRTQGDWLLLNGVDVYGPYQGTLALFGTSTTEGYHSDYSATQLYPLENAPVAGQHFDRLPDWVARRLNAEGYSIGVVNAGISGDTVTDDVESQQNNLQNANQRIARDVLALPNLIGMVTYFGAIDLRSSDCRSAPAIEAATEQMIATAHAAKVPVVMATLPPSAFCTNPAEPNYGPSPSPGDPYAGGATPGPINGAETQRIAFNAWIRTTGASLPGVVGIADLDAALADPSRPDFMLPQYNSGDNYHANGMGYKADAAAIPLNAFLSSSR